MDLDVLFPFHRADKFLLDAIQSLSMSRSVSFRVVAIDDRIDKSVDVSHIFKNLPRVEMLSTKGGQGYGRALELGTAVIEAPHVALFNSDDLIHEFRFKKQITELDNHELSITSMARITTRGKLASSLAGDLVSNRYSPFFLLFGAYGANATWCMRKSWWLKNAFFDSGENLDWRIALNSFRNSSISFIDDPLYFYRKHPLQVTANRNIDSLRMEPVYNQWRQFAESFNLQGNSRSIFDVFATPWLRRGILKSNEIDYWIYQIQAITSNDNSHLKGDLQNLIRRRYLFASMNKNNKLQARFKYGIKGSTQIPKLIRQFIF
jgi:hypothetical protein